MNAETRSAGDLLVRIGGVVFLVGAVATIVTVAPLFLGTSRFPSVAYFVCMLMGVGFLIAAAGVVRSAVMQRRQMPTVDIRADTHAGANHSAPIS